MSSPELLEFTRLVAPISPQSPAGEDLRSDASPNSIYYKIKDARSSARDAERQIAMNGSIDPDSAPDWHSIVSMAPDVLAEKSKDLEIAAYLIEALVREDGFAGLRDGFHLATLLVEQFGDNAYPQPDEDGVETRVAPLTSLNGEGVDGTLIRPILNIPLTDVTSVGQFDASDYRVALELQHLPDDVRARRVEQGGVSMEKFLAAVRETKSDFFQNLMEDIRACEADYTKLTEALQNKYGEFSPPSSNIRNAIENCRSTVEAVAGDKLAVLGTMDQPESSGEAPTQPVGGTATAAAFGQIANREEAFKIILKVAEFFKRTEPHTPISYALERIVRWGEMPLPELLQELIIDQASVQQMFRLVGINPQQNQQ